MSLFSRAPILGVLFAVATATPALASPLTATEILRTFNAVVAGDFAIQSDIAGPAVIGGNLTGGQGDFKGVNLPAAGSTFGAYSTVNVYGDAKNAHYNVNNGEVNVVGKVTGGSSLGSHVNYGASLPYSFNNIWSTLTAASLSMQQLVPAKQAALPTSGSNGAVLNAVQGSVAGQTNVAVIDITAAQLASYADLKINLNGMTTVIINVTGNFVGHPNIHNDQASWMSNVIWNFVDATNVDFGAQGWAGVVLAPNAKVTNGNPIDGTVVAKSYDGQSEIHLAPTQTDLGFLVPSSGSTTGGGQSAVPEPTSFALIGVALAGLLLVRRRSARRPLSLS